ncbi:MAG: metallophosphoesterase [Candidatus Omnitrophica bacterium]|nr:metallophosphoesterase [Candidatus Omnitrophota bacterium]
MRRFVIGDIHGNYRGLKQCLERSKFDHENDLLVSLGDICDRITETREVFDELVKIKNFKMVIGNHDLWMLEWYRTGHAPGDWAYNGGYKTMTSYEFKKPPESHIALLDGAKILIKLGNYLFVHGGLDLSKELTSQEENFVVWDRTFIEDAWMTHMKDPQKKYFDAESIFLGHTPTQTWDKGIPQRFCNVWCLDTGSGLWDGKLSIMDIQTKEYWQSDSVSKLYG